jgi:hypothetical protein
MTNFTPKHPWVRLRHVRSLLEWHAAALADCCALVVSLVPEDILHDRAALIVCLMEELRILSESKIAYLESRWQEDWEKAMGGKFVDLPNLQN